MVKTNTHKAREQAYNNFKKEVLEIGQTLMSRIENDVRKFEQDAFNLAIKHANTINQIKEDIENARK